MPLSLEIVAARVEHVTADALLRTFEVTVRWSLPEPAHRELATAAAQRLGLPQR